MTRRLALLVLTAAMLTQPVLAQSWAEPGTRIGRDSSENSGNMRLQEIINRLKRQYGGRYVTSKPMPSKADIKWYRIDWITDDGRKIRLDVDAKTGRVIR
ncbi:MAG: PepSY domain-containing protein [Pseudomonadota bacterium]